MAIQLPHIEESHSTRYLPPRGEFERFQNDTHYLEKAKEWGLSASKKEFWFKGRTHQRLVKIVGYEIFGEKAEHNTLVIEFQDGNLTCIQPAYLKEMQSSSFGKEIKAQAETESANAEVTETTEEDVKTVEAVSAAATKQVVSKAPNAKPSNGKKEKAVKLVLPEEKVRFKGTVKQFALSWNHFNEENDEVVVLENVIIDQEEPIEVGLAWCAHSKTLKKFELAPGQALEFDGKIVKKSLPKGKDVEDETLRIEGTVSYKINNPSKLTKL